MGHQTKVKELLAQENNHEVTFGDLTSEGLTNVKKIKQSDIRICPHYILVSDHYREDGSCKCDDPEYQKMMIKEWGYTEESFKGIPLRKK